MMNPSLILKYKTGESTMHKLYCSRFEFMAIDLRQICPYSVCQLTWL